MQVGQVENTNDDKVSTKIGLVMVEPSPYMRRTLLFGTFIMD
jgi:hypothetical protein